LSSLPLFKSREIKTYELAVLIFVLWVCNLVCHTKGRTLLRVYENRELRRIFGRKMEEMTRGWRILHNEELHDLYASPDIIRVIKSRKMAWAGKVARMRRLRIAYIIFVGKPEKEKPLGRPRLRWETVLGS
jgi:hypothetical protein